MDEHDLYGAPREQFIAQRTAWAKALRADGLRDEATRVAALRKPSVAAWTVNQLVRAEPERVAQLSAAGDGLRAAQDRMLSGDGTADELREAVERERAAVDALMTVAAQQGMSGAVSDRVAATLHAAALDENARGQVRLGQLVEELQHVGFGGEPLATPRPPVKAAAAPSRAETKRAEERRLAEERKHARHAEREARRHLEAAERALAHAEEHHARASSAFQEAEDKLGAARAQAETAVAEHEVAQRALDSL